MHSEYKQHWAPRTHLGGEFREKSCYDRLLFDLRITHQELMERMFTNEETRLDLLAPYADYSVTLKPARYSNGFGRVIDDHITVHFHVPYGAHEGIQDLMDLLAASANIKPCKI